MNTVDVSPDFIEGEWKRIRTQYNAVKVPEASDNVAASETATGTDVVLSGAAGAVQEDTIQLLINIIDGGLDLVLNSWLELDIDQTKFCKFSSSLAALVRKHNPDLTALQILAKYKEELTFAGATVMLCIAIWKGFKEKTPTPPQVEENEEKEVVSNDNN